MASVSTSLGRESEKTAEFLCQELRQTGTIKEFWHILQNSVLDKQGIDFVCKTTKGYFLIDVKKSSSGVMEFERKKERRLERNEQSFLIYPWRVTLEISKRQEAKAELEIILNKDPSFVGDRLPESVKQELINPTFQSWKKALPNNPAKEEVQLTVQDKLRSMKKRGVLKNMHLTITRVWEVSLMAEVNNSTIEVITHGKYEQAEKAAYEELLNEIKGRVG
ncbi:MAG: hypothetical protein AAB577_02225 [Patescibacteria group bacterium]